MAAPGGGVAEQPGFLGFTPAAKSGKKGEPKRKRINRNKKKSWGKHIDIRDVEEFLEDVRLQERTAGGLLAEQTDDSLFFVDTGSKKKVSRIQRKLRPLRIDLILQPDSKVAAPKDISSHQVPNGRKLKRKLEREMKLEAGGILPRPDRLLQAQLRNKRPRRRPEPNNNPSRGFYDLWDESVAVEPTLEGKESWYLQQTQKGQVKRPSRLSVRPSQLPAVEVMNPGASYNPTFESHQALLLKAHEAEVKKVREEEKLQRQLNLPTAAEAATQESQFQELCEGLVESDAEDDAAAGDAAESSELGAATLARRERKTERQRKKEKEAKMLKVKQEAERSLRLRGQELFQLRSIRADIAQQQVASERRKEQREENRKAAAFKPKRLGRLKYQEGDVDVLLSDELPGTLRKLKPEGSIARDRFKSFQKRNLIEPRERAKFKRKLKVKYLEKRAFREVVL